MDLSSELRHFEDFLSAQAASSFRASNLLNQAIVYSLLAEGKRVRPLLCLGFSELFSGNKNVAHHCATAVEMIHCYSLIHDDLPAMDNDDYRRGKLTNHKVYGEAHAILAGDALLTFAPQFLIKELAKTGLTPTLIMELVSSLLSCSGHQGMILGQAIDMEAEKKIHQQSEMGSELEKIHRLKTGQLFGWSAMAGLYTSLDKELIERHKNKVFQLGVKIGYFFQIIDDLLDATSSLTALGKSPGKDAAMGKLTFISLYGQEESMKMARKIFSEINEEMSSLNGNVDLLKEVLNIMLKKIPNF
jgi:geranylgeranyl pyrophosphate synthase